MKKNIIIGLLILMNLSFIVYSFIKAAEASQWKGTANEQRVEAEKLRDEANSNFDSAMTAAAEAREAQADAEKLRMALEECQSR